MLQWISYFEADEKLGEMNPVSILTTQLIFWDFCFLEIMKSFAFSAVGSLEGQHCIVTKQLKSLDVQKLDICCEFCGTVVEGFTYMIAHNGAVNSHWTNDEVENKNCNFSKAAYGASMTGK